MKEDLKAPANPRQPSGHSRKIGVTMLAQGADWAEVTLPYRTAHAADDRAGTVPIGPIPSIVDSACGATILTCARKPIRFATLDMRIDYLRAPRPGHDLVARGQCCELTEELALISVEVHDGNQSDTIARATCRFFISGV